MIFFIFLFGLAVGSFLNSVVLRLESRESFLLGRSHCPKCRRQLTFWELIPILSFLVLGGRCRFCREKISWQYPAVELATGLAFALVFLNYFSPDLLFESKNWSLVIIYFFRDLFFASILIIIFVYDLRFYLISDQIIVAALVFIFLFNLILIGLGFESANYLINLLLAGLVGGGFFLIQFLISRGRWVGAGDGRVGLIMGLVLGWPEVLVALVLAYLLGALVGLTLVLLSYKKMKSQIPFGPFLALATFITLLYGQNILDWYWQDFGNYLTKFF